jgi:hypothetical protein
MKFNSVAASVPHGTASPAARQPVQRTDGGGHVCLLFVLPLPPWACPASPQKLFSGWVHASSGRLNRAPLCHRPSSSSSTVTCSILLRLLRSKLQHSRLCVSPNSQWRSSGAFVPGPGRSMVRLPLPRADGSDRILFPCTMIYNHRLNHGRSGASPHLGFEANC